MNDIELVYDAKVALGEGPSWDAANQLLYWVDILSQKLYIYDPRSNESRAIHTGQLIGAVVPRKEGGVVLAMQNGFYTLDLDTEQLTPIIDPEQDQPTNRFNDGKCDANGRFWAGTMNLNESEPTGSLYCMEEGHVRKVLSDVTISNGIAWTKDNKTMYYIDTPTKQVVAFDFDLQHATLSNKRTVVTIPEGEGFPDGMNIDDEDMIWVAHWDGYQVSRWNPNTGEKLESIKVPAAKVTSCVFAGVDLDELYITTARTGLSEEELKSQPHAGGLFRIKTTVRGSKTYGFLK
jgi:sugar lactone lactonase YvrE